MDNLNGSTCSDLSSAPSTPHDLPSIFDDTDNVYNTYALPSEDPRRVHHYAGTNAGTPRAKKSRA